MATPDSSSAHEDWLEDLDADELRALIDGAASRIPELGDWLDVQRVARRDDPAELLAIVNRVMVPRRRFYDYGQAND